MVKEEAWSCSPPQSSPPPTPCPLYAAVLFSFPCLSTWIRWTRMSV